MFTQPTVNQIASTYKGNPAPLNAKVDTDRKQNGGIPRDLRQLMAAYDLSQGRQNMGIQQALQIPTNMPTVAEDVQERARQALQARQMQAMQEMQRKNGQPNMVPPGTPRPPMQAQGLDSLETNVGEGYAHGGIIGFDGTGSSQFVQDIASLPQAFDDMKQRVREEDAVKAAQDRRMAQRKQEALDARSKTSFFNYLFGSPEREKEGEAKLAELSSAPLNAPAKPDAVKATPLADIRSQLNAADAGNRAQPGTPAPPRANPNTQAQTRVNVPEAPGIAAALPAEQSAAYKKLSEMMNLDADTQERLAQEKFKKQVGERDLSIYDRTAAELEARKQKLNAPKAGYDAMMEYLEQIAMGGGRTSAESGSIGASRQRALQKERLSQQDLLMDKILELGGKKTEAEYAQKEKMYQVGQERYKEVFKNAFDAAKSVNASDDEAKKIAAQAVENEKNRQKDLRVASIGAQDRDQLMSRAKALMAVDKTLTLDQAMQRAGEIANAGTMEGAAVRNRKAYDDAVEKLGTNYRYVGMLADKKNKPENAALRTEYENKIKELQARYGVTGQGLNALPTSTGLPAGVTVTQVK